MTDEERFEELLESDQSDPEIQYQLGLCYLRGLGVAQDGAQAEAWLRRAADQGHAAAQELLDSQAPEPEPQAPALTEETLPDWCVAAEDGDAEAQYQVAGISWTRASPRAARTRNAISPWPWTRGTPWPAWSWPNGGWTRSSMRRPSPC